MIHPPTKLTAIARRKFVDDRPTPNPVIMALIEQVEFYESLFTRIAEIIGPQLQVHETSAKVAKFNAIRAIAYEEK